MRGHNYCYHIARALARRATSVLPASDLLLLIIHYLSFKR